METSASSIRFAPSWLVLVLAVAMQPGSVFANPGSGLANPASVYCAFLGGYSEVVTDSGGGQSSLCQLPDRENCEEWALYRGDCKVTAMIEQPFEFCQAISVSGIIPTNINGDVPGVLLQGMVQQGIANKELPPSQRRNFSWRCMKGEVWVCPRGANIPCETQLDTSSVPSEAMIQFCQENPGAAAIPAYVTGRATAFSWECFSGQPLLGRQVLHPDSEGYALEFWHQLKPPN